MCKHISDNPAQYLLTVSVILNATFLGLCWNYLSKLGATYDWDAPDNECTALVNYMQMARIGLTILLVVQAVRFYLNMYPNAADAKVVKWAVDFMNYLTVVSMLAYSCFVLNVFQNGGRETTNVATCTANTAVFYEDKKYTFVEVTLSVAIAMVTIPTLPICAFVVYLTYLTVAKIVKDIQNSGDYNEEVEI